MTDRSARDDGLTIAAIPVACMVAGADLLGERVLGRWMVQHGASGPAATRLLDALDRAGRRVGGLRERAIGEQDPEGDDEPDRDAPAGWHRWVADDRTLVELVGSVVDDELDAGGRFYDQHRIGETAVHASVLASDPDLAAALARGCLDVFRPPWEHLRAWWARVQRVAEGRPRSPGAARAARQAAARLAEDEPADWAGLVELEAADLLEVGLDEQALDGLRMARRLLVAAPDLCSAQRLARALALEGPVWGDGARLGGTSPYHHRVVGPLMVTRVLQASVDGRDVGRVRTSGRWIEGCDHRLLAQAPAVDLAEVLADVSLPGSALEVVCVALHEGLGSDPQAWQTAAALAADGFDGSALQLVDVVGRLQGGRD